MNPIMVEHHSKAENARRARQVEHIQQINRAHPKERKPPQAAVRSGRGLRDRLAGLMLILKQWLAARHDRSFRLPGDS